MLLVLTQLQVSIGVDEKARRSIVDPAVGKECSDESLKIMMELCVRCLVDKQSDRPSVEDVQWKLHFDVFIPKQHFLLRVTIKL